MAKISKKKAMIGAIVVMVVWFAIWGIALRYLSNQTEKASVSNFIGACKEYASKNEAFQTEFGKLVDFKTEQEAYTENPAAPGEYYMDFICTTDRGEFTVRIFGCKDPNSRGPLITRHEALPAAQ